ncbi:hypothetical protein ACFOY2_05570 [Nonomuraea purpurea]|uniref:Uncharacterized protein n=1 Tax=Nonomuraea purpurea TaxID=1849276 RepID=A0ABV8G0P5_9ACTN
MTWHERLLEYVALAVLVLAAVAIAFCADPVASLRTRLWTTRCRWIWAARDTTSTFTMLSHTVALTETRRTAIRLLRDVIGDL